MIAALWLCSAATVRGADAVVTAERKDASATAKFEKVPPPSKDDAATKAKFTLVDGAQDPNGATLDVLHDGKLPQNEDEPAACFFFAQRADGGRIAIDLGAPVDVIQVNSYSRHTDTRAPQVYKLYGADAAAKDFDAAPKSGTDPAAKGWTLIAEVDTRKESGGPGGQYGVSVAAKEKEKPLGKFRHLLIDAKATETDDPFGNTFFSEFDVVAKKDGQLVSATQAPADQTPSIKTTKSVDGKYEISIDTTGLDDGMKKWAEDKLRPVCETWYPKLVDMLPSDDTKRRRASASSSRTTWAAPPRPRGGRE